MTTSGLLANQAIGIFDSGIGGLSVAKAIAQLLPQERLIYVADTGYAPYGEKTDAVIYQRMRLITEQLISFGIKALVVACNTATTAAINQLRAEFNLPIIGVEPGIKPAVIASRTGVVAVLATPRTLQTPSFANLADRFATQATILLQPCPLLVPLLEQLEQDSERLTQALLTYLSPLLAQGADTLVLGCTHYNFLAERILSVSKQLAASEISIIRTEGAVARQLQLRLQQLDLLNRDDTSRATVSFYSSGDLRLFQRQVNYYWQDSAEVAALLR